MREIYQFRSLHSYNSKNDANFNFAKFFYFFGLQPFLGVQIGSAVLFVEGKRILNAQQIVIKVMA